jgi:hypothetical protein
MWQGARAASWLAFVLCLLLVDGWAVAQTQESVVVPIEDYPLYDQVVTSKFLTSETRLVLIERLTVSRLYPDQEVPTTIGLFEQNDLFEGRLPPDLVREFIFKNRQPARMGAHFNLGVRYRFVSPQGTEEPEVSLALPALWPPVGLTQDPSLLGRLVFSRVAYTPRSDQALLYVEQHRPDETGAGFLVWFRRQAAAWSIIDTDVLWSIHTSEETSESR